jgi:hypothetical protein
MNGIEIFGYCASALVVLSMTMKDVWMLRLLNSVACSAFVAYGVLINSYPVIIMNAIVIGINVYKMYQDGKEQKGV